MTRLSRCPVADKKRDGGTPRTVGRIDGRLDLKVDRDEVLAIVEGTGPRT
jgi:hypothetical protein